MTQSIILNVEGQTGPPLSSRGQAQYEAATLFKRFQEIMRDIYHPENNPDVCIDLMLNTSVLTSTPGPNSYGKTSSFKIIPYVQLDGCPTYLLGSR